MAIICTALVLALPAVTQRFIDVVIAQERRDLLISTAGLGLAAIFLRQLLFTLRSYLNSALEQRLIHNFRIEVYDKLQRLPIKWFDKNSSGEIMSRVADDVPAIDRVIVEGMDQAITGILQFLLVLGYMFFHSWELTLITLLPLPFIGILTSWYTKSSEAHWRESSEASSALNALLHDNLSGIRQIKAYTVEPEALNQFGDASNKARKKHMRVMKGQAIVWPSVSLLAESGIILMVGFGAYWVLNDKLSAGTVIAFLVAWGFLFDPISRINNLTQLFMRGIVSGKRVFAILDKPDATNLTEGLRPEKFHAHIKFENVSFSYSPDATTLKNITLEAKPGQTIAFVGPTGAGKSTILNLLTRFYDIDHGNILLDGTSISKLSKEWLRDHTGFITQESFLFNKSLRNNLLLAKQHASDEEVWHALEAANAASFVRELPEQLDTVAGERGVRFSGGEKQRLSIARALLKNTPLLLLDEATSALDNKTETLVQQALDRLRSDRTSFVIAHRLSTIRSADLICVLDKGEMVERGTHEELSQRSGLYAKLCEAQFKDDV